MSDIMQQALEEFRGNHTSENISQTRMEELFHEMFDRLVVHGDTHAGAGNNDAQQHMVKHPVKHASDWVHEGIDSLTGPAKGMQVAMEAFVLTNAHRWRQQLVAAAHAAGAAVRTVGHAAENTAMHAVHGIEVCRRVYVEIVHGIVYMHGICSLGMTLFGRLILGMLLLGMLRGFAFTADHDLSIMCTYDLSIMCTHDLSIMPT